MVRRMASDAALHYEQTGDGRPLLLLHGLGGDGGSWAPVIPRLAAERRVLTVDLPGFGRSRSLAESPTVEALADAVDEFLAALDLSGVDVAGMSLGAQVALELRRRSQRRVNAVVAFGPSGFWSTAEQHFFSGTVFPSVVAVRALHWAMPALTRSAAGRTVLFSQLSPRPWQLDGTQVLEEMRRFKAATGVYTTLRALGRKAAQMGTTTPGPPITIAWGRRDRICLPRQAARALDAFPDAELRWLEHCGHFAVWDVPEQAASLILERTSGHAAA